MEEQTDLFRSARFRKEREGDWIRLEALVAKAESQGLRRMSFGEARDLAALYREATTSLAIAREISLDKGLLLYLEALAARAYAARHQGLDAVISYIVPDNTRSAALAARLGAVIERDGTVMGHACKVWRHPHVAEAAA